MLSRGDVLCAELTFSGMPRLNVRNNNCAVQVLRILWSRASSLMLHVLVEESVATIVLIEVEC